MLRVTLKGIWAHKLRLSLTALAVVLGVGFIAGTFIYTDTIGKAFDGIFDDAFEGVDIVVSADSELQFGEGIQQSITYSRCRLLRREAIAIAVQRPR